MQPRYRTLLCIYEYVISVHNNGAPKDAFAFECKADQLVGSRSSGLEKTRVCCLSQIRSDASRQKAPTNKVTNLCNVTHLLFGTE